jgi:hypothetical protein
MTPAGPRKSINLQELAVPKVRFLMKSLVLNLPMSIAKWQFHAVPDNSRNRRTSRLRTSDRRQGRRARPNHRADPSDFTIADT